MHGIHLGTARSRWSRIIAGVALLAFTTGTLLVVTESSLSASTSTSLPAHTPPSHAPSWNLEHVTFSSATMGYGVFQRESWTGQSCEDFVGKTGDGGVHFTSLVRAMSWNCNRSFFDSSLVVDAYGNGFLFGPSLFVTHDAGASWTRSANVDLVLAVDTIGRSVWLVESTCRNSQLAKYYDCRAKLLASTNGGRTWATLPSLPKVLVDTGEASANGQTYLVRVSKLEAYVLGRPLESVRGKPVAAPLWFTSNGGRTWSNRQIPCGLNAFSAVLAAAPDGTLEAVCAGGPSARLPAQVSASIDQWWAIVGDEGPVCRHASQIMFVGTKQRLPWPNRRSHVADRLRSRRSKFATRHPRWRRSLVGREALRRRGWGNQSGALLQ